MKTPPALQKENMMLILKEFKRIRASGHKVKWVQIECPSCGKACEMTLGSAKKGVGCGCLGGKKTHGMGGTPIYKTWVDMLRRCNNPKCKKYHDYGGRKITVIDRWLKFENFHEDMGPRPDGSSLDRINNDGNYGPDNCRWSTALEQNDNRRNTVMINGEPLAVVARRHGMSRSVLYQRYVILGWTLEEALNTPVRKRKSTITPITKETTL